MRENLTRYAERLNVPLVVFSAGMAFLVCALLAGCGLVALLLWNFTFPGGGGRPTPRPTLERIAAVTETASVTITVTSNTSSPTLTSLPLLTPLLPPTTLPLPASPPDEAVREYYRLVSEKRYESSWPRLSEAFKQIFNCCTPNYDYAGYSAWWDSVERVELGQVRTVSQSGDRAVVYAELFYHMKAGGTSRDAEPYIELIYDPANGGWLFNNKGTTASLR